MHIAILGVNQITYVNQLTISNGSDNEKVKLGSGDDVVIGNNLDNVIITGIGNDTVFTGEGSDIVNLGSGYDRVDLSEDIEARDTVIFNQDSFGIGFDTYMGLSKVHSVIYWK